MEYTVDDMCKEYKWGPFTIKIKWVYDYDCMSYMDYYGEYKNEPTNELYIDRKLGAIPSETIEIQRVWKVNITPIKGEKWYNTANRQARIIEQYLGDEGFVEIHVDDYEYDHESKLLAATASVTAVLARDLQTMCTNEYRYFENDNYPDISEENAKYLVQDYERMCDYHKNYWSMLGCTVSAHLDGNEIRYDSLWGIESDSEDSYFEEVENDLIAQVKEGLGKEVCELHEFTVEAMQFLKMKEV